MSLKHFVSSVSALSCTLYTHDNYCELKRLLLLSGCLSAGTTAPRMPLGAAVSLPLSGSVGVHHTGRVHPRANGQRLLLHAGRSPAGQVVLDPEHLRGPDAPTAAAAAVQPRGQDNTSKKQEEEEKSAAKRKVQQKRSKSTGRRRSMLSSPTSKHLEV